MGIAWKYRIGILFGLRFIINCLRLECQFGTQPDTRVGTSLLKIGEKQAIPGVPAITDHPAMTGAGTMRAKLSTTATGMDRRSEPLTTLMPIHAAAPVAVEEEAAGDILVKRVRSSVMAMERDHASVLSGSQKDIAAGEEKWAIC